MPYIESVNLTEVLYITEEEAKAYLVPKSSRQIWPIPNETSLLLLLNSVWKDKNKNKIESCSQSSKFMSTTIDLASWTLLLYLGNKDSFQKKENIFLVHNNVFHLK